MPRPADGHYRLFLPPIPVPANVIVNSTGVRLAGTTNVYPYVEAFDVFSIGPETGLECTGAGTWRLSDGDVTFEGTCEGPL